MGKKKNKENAGTSQDSTVKQTKGFFKKAMNKAVDTAGKAAVGTVKFAGKAAFAMAGARVAESFIEAKTGADIIVDPTLITNEHKLPIGMEREEQIVQMTRSNPMHTVDNDLGLDMGSMAESTDMEIDT